MTPYIVGPYPAAAPLWNDLTFLATRATWCQALTSGSSCIQSLGKGDAQDRRPGLVRDLQRAVEPVGDGQEWCPDQIASRLKRPHLHLDPAGDVLAFLVSEQAVTVSDAQVVAQHGQSCPNRRRYSASGTP